MESWNVKELKTLNEQNQEYHAILYSLKNHGIYMKLEQKSWKILELKKLNREHFKIKHITY